MNAPQWVRDYAQDCRILLGIGDEWRITITMTDKPNGSSSTGGSVSIDAEYCNATIELNSGVFAEENDKAYQVIFHETMHIALANYRMVLDQIFMSLPDNMQAMARIMVSQAEEQYIQRTSRALLRSLRPEQ